MDDAPIDLERPAVAATTLSACSLPGAIERADAPLWVWRDPDGHAHLGTGEAIRLVAEGATRFGTVEDGLEGLTDHLAADEAGPRAFIGARFFHDAPRGPSPWDPYPSAVAAVPSVQIHFDPEGTATLSVVDVNGPTDLEARLAAQRRRFEGASAPPPGLPAVTDVTHHPTAEAWQEAVGAITERLSTPSHEKAVLAGETRLDLSAPPSPGPLVAALIDRHPGCWTVVHAPTPETMFVSATPERLATVHDGRLQTVALAGTIGRGETPAADDRLRDTLLDRESSRHEHAAVVGDIVGRLGGACDAIRVADRRVRQLADVQHLETPIEATLRDGVGLLDVAGRLHPTPAVGGRPRASALGLIREFEAIERGWYAAPIGIVDPAGDGTLAVAIRSARIDHTHATVYAGNGIVAESDPAEEWEERLLKVQAMAEVFDG